MSNNNAKERKCNILYFLVNLFFIFILLPYVSPVPIKTDVQPIAGLIAFILIVMSLPRVSTFSVKRVDFIFMLFAIFSLIYYLPLYGEYDIKKRVGLFFAFGIFYVIRKYHHLLSFRLFFAVVTINFSCFVFHCLYPELFVDIFGGFVRIIKLTEFEYRGASGLAPENSFAAFTAIFYLFVLYYFGSRIQIKMVNKVLIIGMSLFIIMLSKSGTGYFIGLLIFICYLIETKKVKWLVVSLVIIMFLLFYLNDYYSETFSRGIQVTKLLLTNPQTIFQDPSASYRIHNIIIGFLSLTHYPIGLGGGSFEYVSALLSDLYGLEQLYIPAYAKSIISSGVVSPFSQYLVENGFFFILFIAFMFTNSRKQRLYYTSNLFILYSLLFFPIVYPAAWFIFGVTSRYDKYAYLRPLRKKHSSPIRINKESPKFTKELS